MNVKFLKDRGQYKKGDVVSLSDYHANMLARSDRKSVELDTKDSPNLNGSKLSERQESARKSKAEKLKKEADSLESARK